MGSIEGRPGIALVVDDDRPLLEMAEVILEIEGWKTLAAGDSDEALAVFRARQEAGLPPLDQIVTDVQMPNPRDGINMVLELIKRGFRKPVLMMTGAPQDVTRDDITAIQKAGVPVAVLKKPFGFDELTSAINRLQNVTASS